MLEPFSHTLSGPSTYNIHYFLRGRLLGTSTHHTFRTNSNRLQRLGGCVYICPQCGTEWARVMCDPLLNTWQCESAECPQCGGGTLGDKFRIFSDGAPPLAVLRHDFLLLTNHMETPSDHQPLPPSP